MNILIVVAALSSSIDRVQPSFYMSIGDFTSREEGSLIKDGNTAETELLIDNSGNLFFLVDVVADRDKVQARVDVDFELTKQTRLAWSSEDERKIGRSNISSSLTNLDNNRKYYAPSHLPAGRYRASAWVEAYGKTNGDASFGRVEVQVWEPKGLDINGDRRFNQADLVGLLNFDSYNRGYIPISFSYERGDYNGDNYFNKDDIILALQDGVYNKGNYLAQQVPEPCGLLLAFLSLVLIMFKRNFYDY